MVIEEMYGVDKLQDVLGGLTVSQLGVWEILCSLPFSSLPSKLQEFILTDDRERYRTIQELIAEWILEGADYGS